MIISSVLAVLAAISNAGSNVLQRRANSEEPPDRSLSPRLIWDLLHRGDWLLGVGFATASFLLQAGALSAGELAYVQPIILLELPLTMVAAKLVLGSRLGKAEWCAIGMLTVGLAGLVGFLSPSGGTSHVGALSWVIGAGLTAGLVALLVVTGRASSGSTKAGLLGAAAGITFGLTAALMKAMTDDLSHGLQRVFTNWPVYAMVAAGIAAMFLVQNALQAGRLVAAQPGISLLDPFSSIAWGVLAFHEQTNHGALAALAGVSGLTMSAGALLLSRSPALQAVGQPGQQGQSRPCSGPDLVLGNGPAAGASGGGHPS